MSRPTLGKPLKGYNKLSQRGGVLDVDIVNATSVIINDIDITTIVDGNFVFDPIDINSGTIDGVVIGADEPGPAFFTTIQSGTNTGTGFNVIFYSTTFGDFVSWDPNNSTFLVNGNLIVRDDVNLGNLQISGNTISSTDTNGDIILDPDGTGCVVINSCITQSSTLGDVTFDVVSGKFEAISTDNVILESLDKNILLESHSNTEITTHNGDIIMTTEIGARLCISNISVGAGSVTITTLTEHNLVAGATITFYNTNSTPNIDGINSIVSIIDSKKFTISDTVTIQGNDGQIIINVDIASINIGSPIITITTVNDHNFNIDDTIDFNNTNSTPSLDGTTTINTIIDNKNFTILGTTTGTGSTGTVTKYLKNTMVLKSETIKISGNLDINNDNCNGSTQRFMNIYDTDIKIDDPLIMIGGVNALSSDDNKDKGLSFRWYDTSAKTGFFGFDDSTNCFIFIPDATITSGVVSGTPGCLEAGDITVTQIDLQGGDIINSGDVTVTGLIGNPDITLTAADIYLTVTGDVILPEQKAIEFGSEDNKIEFNSSAGGFCIESSTNIKLTPGNSYDIIIPSNNGIVLDGNISGTSTQKIESNGTDITINTSDLNLTATNDINIPQDVGLTFGGDSQKIEYNGSSLDITADGDIKLYPTSSNDVIIPCDIGLSFTGDTTNITHTIESNCTDLTITATKISGTSDINLTAKTNVNIPDNVGLTFGIDSRNIISNGSDITVNSNNDINLTPATGGDINIPLNIGLSLGDDNTKLENNGTNVSFDTDKNLLSTATGNITSTSSTGDVSLISTIGDIYLTPSDNSKSIILPLDVDITFGASTTNITSNGANLEINTNADINLISGDDINLSASDKVHIPDNIELEFGTSTEYIVGDGTNLDIYSGNNINVNAALTTITGNLQVNGTTTTVNSTVMTIDDPIITIGGDTAPIIDDNKDRGIEFRWHNGTSAKIGFFGFDDSTGCFTFISDGINTSEVFSGVLGCISIGSLDLNNGDILNGNVINATELCNSSGDLDLTSSADINITPGTGGDVNIPDNIGLTFGNDSHKIEYSDTATKLIISTSEILSVEGQTVNIESSSDINLNATNSVDIPSNIPLEFGNSNNYISGDGTNIEIQSSSGDLSLTGTDIELNATNSVDIPSGIPLNLNNSETSYLIGAVSGDVSLIAENDILLDPGTGNDTRIPVNTGLVFETTGTGNKIEYNGVDLCIDSTGDIKLNPGGGDINLGGANIINGDWEGNVISTTYGGTGHGDWTVGSVIYAGSTTSLDEENTKFFWRNSIDRLYIGTNSGGDLTGGLTVASSGTVSFRNSFDNTDTPGLNFQNANQNYTWNVYRSPGSGSGTNSNFHIAGGINQTTLGNLNERFVIEETGTVGINFPSVSVSISSNTSANPTEITTASPHDLETGNLVTISGSDAVPSINGTYTITVTDTNKFTIPVDTTIGFTSATTGTTTITHADRVDNSSKDYIGIVSNTLANPTVITTSSNHNFNTNDIVKILNHAGDIPIGDYVITKITNNSFSIPFNSSVSGSGTVVKDVIKLHVNGCIKLAERGGDGSSCILFGSSGHIESNGVGDIIINSSSDIDFNLNSGNNINIPSLVGITFGNDSTFIKFDGTDLCIDSLGDIKLTPTGTDVVINGNLFVTGTTNIDTGGSGGVGTVDDYIVCIGKGQDLAIVSYANSGANTVDITTATHNLITGDVVVISDSDTTPVIDGQYTCTVISTIIVRITFTGSISNPGAGNTGNLRSKHVTDPGKDVGICIDWHDGLATGTANANQGFFGMDRSTIDQRFKYIPDATIVADVVSGGVGNAEFNKLFSVDAEISSLTDTQVVFAGTNGLLETDSGMTYNSTTDTLTVTGGIEAPNLVEKEDFDANTILKADTDDTPIALTVPEDTLVGRLSGGQITALTISQINTLLNINSFERFDAKITSSISSNTSANPTEITTSTNHGLSTKLLLQVLMQVLALTVLLL